MKRKILFQLYNLTRKGTYLLVIILLLFSFFISTTITDATYTTEIIIERNTLDYDDPIQISSDAGWAAYSFPGDGSAGNPFIIENYVLNETLFVSNTQYSFKVSNCTVNCTTGDAYDLGINLSSIGSEVAEVYNNTFIAKGSVVHISSSYDLVFNNNTIESQKPSIDLWGGDPRAGIEISDSPRTTLANNTVLCYFEGIIMRNSEDTIIENNIFTGSGIDIYRYADLEILTSYTFENNWINDKKFGYLNSLEDQTFDIDEFGQLYLVNCTNVSVKNQEISYNYTGVDVIACSDCDIINITLSDEYDSGIGLSISESTNTKAINNTISNSKINVYLSSLITIFNNTIHSDSSTISLSETPDSIIANNTIFNGSVYMNDCLNTKIENNTIYNSGFSIYELLLSNYKSYSINDNWVNGKIFGYMINLYDSIIDTKEYGQIYLVECANVDVINQDISNTTLGIQVVFSSDIEVSNSTFRYCSDAAIGFRDSNSVTAKNNTCILSNRGIDLTDTDDIILENNTIDGSGGACIAFYSCNYVLISRNVLMNAEWQGIFVSYTDYCTIVFNELINNGNYGVRLSSGSDDNWVHHNNFIDNNLFDIWGTKQARDDGSRNTWYHPALQEGNYWSDITIPGIYYLDGSAGSTDIYPLNYPFDIPIIDEYSNTSIVWISILIPILTSILSFGTKKTTKK